MWAKRERERVSERGEKIKKNEKKILTYIPLC